MLQRWLAAVCLHGEKGFKRIKGYRGIKEVVRRIEVEQAEEGKLQTAA